jgi:hypothetical protein
MRWVAAESLAAEFGNGGFACLCELVAEVVEEKEEEEEEERDEGGGKGEIGDEGRDEGRRWREYGGVVVIECGWVVEMYLYLEGFWFVCVVEGVVWEC